MVQENVPFPEGTRAGEKTGPGRIAMPDTTARDLAQLEQLISKLQVTYEQFFSGGIAKEPLDLVRQAEGIIRTYNVGQLKNPVNQFRFTNLQARYNSYRNVWERRRRQLEGGVKPHAWGVKTIRPSEEDHFTLVVSDLPLRQSQVDGLFNHYLALRRRCGEQADKIRWENFSTIVTEHVKKLRDRTGCSAVVIKVDIHDKRSRISAKPFRD